MRAIVVLLALLLSGCAGEPAPLTAPDAVLGEGPDLPLRGPPMLAWSTLADGPFRILAGGTHEVSVTIPANALAVVVNLTLEQGAAQGLRVQVGACDWQRNNQFVAIGQTIGADCGGLAPATESVVITTQSGLLAGREHVVALTCLSTPETSACPARLPTGS